MCFCSVSQADFLFASSQQAGTVIETVGTQRAVYLGRFFFDRPTPAEGFIGIWAGATIQNANNVQLFLGNSNLTFNGNISMVSTGVALSQLTSNPTFVAAPGLPPLTPGTGVAPLALSASAGNTLRQLLESNGFLDGWLVSNNPNHLFTAPSSSVPGSGNPVAFNAFVGITAVPEPGSMALVGLLIVGAGAVRLRRRFVA